jgi:hypothetical protein
MESRSIACATANDAAAARASLTPTVTADFNAATARMVATWNARVPNNSPGHLGAYQAGQVSLDAMITQIVAFANAQGFCNDNNSCTTDQANSTGPTCCVNTPVANGTPCDDGNPNTRNDACQAGVCVGQP